MNIPVKYRVWIKSIKKILPVVGFCFNDPTGDVEVEYPNKGQYRCWNSQKGECVVMQYIGLKDAIDKGNEIYTRDILKFKSAYPHAKCKCGKTYESWSQNDFYCSVCGEELHFDEDIIGEVIYVVKDKTDNACNRRCQFCVRTADELYSFDYVSFINKITILGNTFENPELTKIK